MDTRHEELEKLKEYIKSGGDPIGNFINGVNYTTPDKALPSELYKMVMDEINKNTPKSGGLYNGQQT